MAPLTNSEAMSPHLALDKQAHVRDSGTAGTQSSSGPVQGAASTPAVSSTIYLGIGVGVGGAILLAIIVVGVQILRKRAQHRRAVAELEEHSEPVVAGQRAEIGEVPRPVSVARCSALGPLHARAGWGALSSDETIHQPANAAQKDKRKRNSISLPKKVKQRGIPLKRLKYLSAIMESPRSRTTKSPSPAVLEQVKTTGGGESRAGSSKKKTVNLVRKSEDDEDVFTAPGSPKPHVLPSFAIRSPGMYGAAIANDDRPRPPRSVSVGALLVPIPENAVFGHTARMSSRPPMHARSISLGAPQSRSPSGPVPPLPVIAPHAADVSERNRQGLCVSRMSSSSQESASSSVLVTSPILKMHEDHQPIGSPSVEEVIADDDSAQLKSVTNRQWQNPLITGPRPMDVPRLHSTTSHTSAGVPLPKHHVSIRSNIARYSTNSASQRDSIASAISSLDEGDLSTSNRLSIPQIGTADRVSISRVSSFNSLKAPGTGSGTGTRTSTAGAVQKITTPRKPSRQSSVSANGSPAERRKTSILRDISGNAQMLTPSRQTSQSTQDSGRSSNGNPFQWDQCLPLMKHSALKGSPNSKGSKGHKRQNCVRISTLTPQILGPPPSRPTSPTIMHGIEEEESEGGEGHALGFVSHRLSRPPSASSFAPNLRIPTLRASLTPSSPTLSTWTAYQEQQENGGAPGGLPSQHSDSQLSVSPIATNGRSASRLSGRSSAFTIPAFPSPSRAPVATVQLDHHQPIPEFSLSRPSTDDADELSSSPFALHASSEDEEEADDTGLTLPSSPPLPASKETEYDPAWPMLTVPAPSGAGPEYDPASPVWPQDEVAAATEHSSAAFFPFAAGTASHHISSDIENISPHSRPTSYGGDLPDTPPCSPHTMPEGFRDFFAQPVQEPVIRARPARTTAAEKLTSANASAIMATIPESPPTVGFPSAVPVLSPPAEDGVPNTTPKARRQRAVSNALQVQPLRSTPQAPTSAPKSSDPVEVPSPLHIKFQPQQQSPQGPRDEPAKSVLKNAMALRRMNSEIDQTRNTNRESRRYVRLGREASPLLPWIGSPDPSESCNDLFDFDFGSLDTGAGAALDAYDVASSVGREKSALDDIDMSALDRRLGGALAGFDAGPRTDTSPSVASYDQARSSVWEDGEKFWEGKPDFQFTPSSPLPVNVTPVKKCSAWGRECERSGSMTPTQQRWLKMPEAPSSIQKTPRSLYDSDGFLRS